MGPVFEDSHGFIPRGSACSPGPCKDQEGRGRRGEEGNALSFTPQRIRGIYICAVIHVIHTTARDGGGRSHERTRRDAASVWVNASSRSGHRNDLGPWLTPVDPPTHPPTHPPTPENFPQEKSKFITGPPPPDPPTEGRVFCPLSFGLLLLSCSLCLSGGFPSMT